MLNKMCVNWAWIWLLFSLPTSFVGWKQLIVGCDNQPRDTGEEEVSHHKQQWTTIFSPLVNFNPRMNNYPHLKTWTNWQSSTTRAGRHTRPALLVLVEDCSGYSLHFSVKYHQPLCKYHQILDSILLSTFDKDIGRSEANWSRYLDPNWNQTSCIDCSSASRRELSLQLREGLELSGRATWNEMAPWSEIIILRYKEGLIFPNNLLSKMT